jgi:hypothetical protein
LSQPATTGRLAQVCDRWIYTACLCFGLDVDEQARSGFGYGYSVHQAEYSRNLLFTVGAQMDRVFDRVVDRTGPGWTCRPSPGPQSPNGAPITWTSVDRDYFHRHLVLLAEGRAPGFPHSRHLTSYPNGTCLTTK